jgi:hypothetical protein
MNAKALFSSCLLLPAWLWIGSAKAADGKEQPGEALERLGARVGRSALAVWPWVTDETKKLVSQNKYALVVIGTDWTGGVEGLKYLKAQAGIRGVMFSHRAFEDAWCECLKEMSNLKEVYVWGERFTDKGMKALEGLRELEALSLATTQVTDDGLAVVKGMKRLQWLSLAGVFRITDAGAEHLRGLKELRRLNLDCTEITGDGMVHLKGATRMEWLRLSGCLVVGENRPDGRMVPAGLKYLEAMKRLKYLDIGSMQTSPAEMKALMEKVKTLERIETSDLVLTREGWKDRQGRGLDRVLQRVLDNLKD